MKGYLLRQKAIHTFPKHLPYYRTALNKLPYIRLPAHQALVGLTIGCTNNVDLARQYQWTEDVLNEVGVFILDGLEGMGIKFQADCEPWKLADHVDGFLDPIEYREGLLVVFLADKALAEIPAHSGLVPVVHNREVTVGRDQALRASNQARHRRSAKAPDKYPTVHMRFDEASSWQHRKFLLLVSRYH